jgi:hypothetical protein
MRRFIVIVLFALFCVFAGALWQPTLAAPREMNAYSAYTTHGSFQVLGAYRSHSIVRSELYTYPKRRIRSSNLSGSVTHNNHLASADAFFYDQSSPGGAE